MNVVLITIGAIMLLFGLGAVNKFSMFGNECYYIGQFDVNAICFKPIIYYIFMLIALLILAKGGYGFMKKGSSEVKQ